MSLFGYDDTTNQHRAIGVVEEIDDESRARAG